MKICSKCKIELSYSSFTKLNRSKDGFSHVCKECIHEKYLKTRDKCIERAKKHAVKHKESRKQYMEKYYKDNLQDKKIYDKQRREKLKKDFKQYDSIYYQKNKQRINERITNKKKTNNEFLCACRLRSYLSFTLKKAHAFKSEHTVTLLGCSFKQFVKHIESQFTQGMSWDNYGKTDSNWSLDHICPCAAFDLTDFNEQKKCFHYTNLQPLWNIDNWSKNSKYNGKYIRKKA